MIQAKADSATGLPSSSKGMRGKGCEPPVSLDRAAAWLTSDRFAEVSCAHAIRRSFAPSSGLDRMERGRRRDH